MNSVLIHILKKYNLALGVKEVV